MTPALDWDVFNVQLGSGEENWREVQETGRCFPALAAHRSALKFRFPTHTQHEWGFSPLHSYFSNFHFLFYCITPAARQPSSVSESPHSQETITLSCPAYQKE